MTQSPNKRFPKENQFLNGRGRGSVLLQAIVSLVVMGGLTSLSVDVGMFFTAKLELQRAADAAALAAADSLHGGGTNAQAAALAVSYAQSNVINGESIGTSSVETAFLGTFAGTYVENVTPTTAVKVKLHRTRVAGNPVRLYFAQFLGLDSIDAHAASIVKIRQPAPTYNLVGLDHATFGSLGVLARVNGRFVSNGQVSIGMPAGLAVGVNGDARSFSTTIQKGAMAYVSGSVARLSDSLDYPAVTLPPNNDNANIAAYLDGSGNFNVVAAANIPAGTYVVNNLNLLAGVAINLQGDTTFYVKGSANIGVAVSLLGSNTFSASSFKIRVVSGGTVCFIAPILAPINLDLYAPQSDIAIAVGVSAYKGRLIGKSLDIALPIAGNFTEDTTLPDPLAGTPAIALTQ